MSPNEPESGGGKLNVRREISLKWTPLFTAVTRMAVPESTNPCLRATCVQIKRID
jgi:hypothetical protein